MTAHKTAQDRIRGKNKTVFVHTAVCVCVTACVLGLFLVLIKSPAERAGHYLYLSHSLEDDRALGAMYEAVRLNPRTVENWNQLALALEVRGFFQKASKARAIASKLDPSAPIRPISAELKLGLMDSRLATLQ